MIGHRPLRCKSCRWEESLFFFAAGLLPHVGTALEQARADKDPSCLSLPAGLGDPAQG